MTFRNNFILEIKLHINRDYSLNYVTVEFQIVIQFEKECINETSIYQRIDNNFKYDLEFVIEIIKIGLYLYKKDF